MDLAGGGGVGVWELPEPDAAGCCKMSSDRAHAPPARLAGWCSLPCNHLVVMGRAAFTALRLLATSSKCAADAR